MTKRRLKELDEHLKEWDDLANSNAIPAGAYDRTIAKVQQERAELVNTIGRKKCRSNTKK
jgi:chorismate mutase